MNRILNDRVDNLQTSTIDGHNRKFFRHLLYQSELRTGKFGEPYGVVIDTFGIHLYNAQSEEVILFDVNGDIWMNVSGTLTKIQTFDDGSGHNVLYV